MKTCTANTRTELATLVDLLRSQATERPEQKIFTFLGNGEDESASLTFAEWDWKARGVGATLQKIGAQGERVLLLCETAQEFIPAFFGCLYAGAIAVPASPPRLRQRDARLRSIVKDCQPVIALTGSALMVKTDLWMNETEELRGLNWISVDGADDGAALDWSEPSLSSESLAFLQFTSGSTATPRGVMISHGNILHNLNQIKEISGHTPNSSCVNWLPLFHDLGLISGILLPLFKGFHCVQMPPVTFLQRPFRWLQAISRYRTTHNMAPSFAYDLCARKVTPPQIAELDLSCWTRAGIGAEPVHKKTLTRFEETFGPCGFSAIFCPCYGLAEATLKVTMVGEDRFPDFLRVKSDALAQNRVEITEDEKGSQTLVGSGFPSVETKLEIVNPESLTRCAADEIGEIWISGPSVGMGYWQRPEETAKTFMACLAVTGEGPFLRSGDLGFIRHGQLFIAGRLKDLIIIDGQNYYPQDIELAVEASHPALRAGHSAAFAIDLDGEERLVIMAELERSERHTSKEIITDAIRKCVSEENGLGIHRIMLVKTGSIPKTSSGKIQRQGCRASYLAGNVSEEN